MISVRDRKKMAETLEQLDRVDTFFAQFRNADGSLKGGVNEYATLDQFEGLLRQHLDELFLRRLPAAPAGGKPRQIKATIPDAYLAVPASRPVGPPVDLSPVCCAARPGTTIRTTRAQPTATGTTRTTGTTTSVFGWCVRPHRSAPFMARRVWASCGHAKFAM
jgi:hypothetical protein